MDRRATMHESDHYEPAHTHVTSAEPHAKSNDFNMFMFMISATDFKVSLLGAVGASAPPTALQEGPQPRDAARQTDSCRADFMTAGGQLSRPPPGSLMAVSGQFLVAAVIRPLAELMSPPRRPSANRHLGLPSIANGHPPCRVASATRAERALARLTHFILPLRRDARKLSGWARRAQSSKSLRRHIFSHTSLN